MKILLRKCFGGSRYIYNKAVDYTKKLGKCPSFYDLRKAVVIPDRELSEKNKWLSEIPYDTRQNVLKELVSVYKTHNTKRIRKYEISYKEKHNAIQTCHVNKKALTPGLKIFTRRLKKFSHLRIPKGERKWLSERVHLGDYSDFIVLSESNQYYLCITTEEKIGKHTSSKEVALDPGVRTFQTYYSPQSCGKLGEDITKKIKPIFKRIDKLNAVKALGRTKRNIDFRLRVLRTKVRNVVRNLHHDISKFLCTKFKTIFIPEFKSQNMVRGKKLTKSTKKSMLSLSHYKFRQRLIHKAKIYGTTVIVCTEPYTSKTCTRCGHIHESLGSNEVYHCSSCGLVIDRDIGAARNIYIRNYSGSDKMQSVRV